MASSDRQNVSLEPCLDMHAPALRVKIRLWAREIVARSGVASGRFWPHIAGMQNRPWKVIAHVSGLDGNPGWREYFIVYGSRRG
jgi:hypothetical protein